MPYSLSVSVAAVELYGRPDLVRQYGIMLDLRLEHCGFRPSDANLLRWAYGIEESWRKERMPAWRRVVKVDGYQRRDTASWNIAQLLPDTKEKQKERDRSLNHVDLQGGPKVFCSSDCFWKSRGR